jgi:hypothetical protein
MCLHRSQLHSQLLSLASPFFLDVLQSTPGQTVKVLWMHSS